MRENKFLKWLLIIQSFLPLFFLVLIRCFSIARIKLIVRFLFKLFQGDFGIIELAIRHSEFLSVVLLCICVLMFTIGLLIYLFFNSVQKYGFQEESEKIVVEADATENSVAFFVTYITPFVLDDIGQCKGFISFATIIIMLVLLMRNTNLYYQNPFLTILGYKSFYYHFDKESNTRYVAITKGPFDATRVIKRKLISNNTYLVYNKN